MNPFRGLMDLLNIGKKPDEPKTGDAGENPVPVLKDILAALRTAPAPSQSRPPLPPPPEKIQPTAPPVPQGNRSPAEIERGRLEQQAYIDSLLKGKSIAPVAAPSASAESASSPVVNVPPAPAGPSPNVNVQAPAVNIPPAPSTPAPNVNVSPPVVNVPSGNTPQPEPQPADSSGIFAGFTQRIGELFSSFTGTLADLVGKLTGVPRDAAPAENGPGGTQPQTPAGPPPAPTGASQPPPGNTPPPPGTPPAPPSPKGQPGQPKPPKATIGQMVFDKLTNAASLVGVFGKEAWNAGQKLLEFAVGINEANRGISMYSGQLASAFAQLDVTKIQNDIRQAQATGGSGSGLADELRGLQNDFQPLKETIGTLKNSVAKLGVQILRPLTQVANFANETLGIKEVAENIEANTQNRDAQQPSVEQLHDLASGQWITRRNIPGLRGDQRQDPLQPL